MAASEAATNTAPATKGRKKGVPMVRKPFHLLLTYRDESGNIVPLTQAGISIQAVKDPAELLHKLLSGGMEGAVYVTFQP